VPSAHPFILVNYTARADDVKTLAHELGHGVHMALSSEKQTLLNVYTPLTTAEMASVFGEMMVFQDLMRKEPDAEARLAMLAQKLEDTFATVFRQVSMNRFEDALHNSRRREGELSSERISELWMESQRAMFQGSVNLRDDYGIWWSYIPHFLNSPGYVYAYAFGELLVLALYNLYQERGAEFVPQYLEVLGAGDSDWPENILAKVGVDLSDPGFWKQGLDAIRALVEQEEQLAREVYPERFR
jgi:oligoendopeptidase F